MASSDTQRKTMIEPGVAAIAGSVASLAARLASYAPRLAAPLLQRAGSQGVRLAMTHEKGRTAIAALIDAAATDTPLRVRQTIHVLLDSVPAAWQARLLRSLTRSPNDAALALLAIEGDDSLTLWEDAEGRQAMTALVAAAADALPWMAAGVLRTIIDSVPAKQWMPLARTASQSPNDAAYALMIMGRTHVRALMHTPDGAGLIVALAHAAARAEPRYASAALRSLVDEAPFDQWAAMAHAASQEPQSAARALMTLMRAETRAWTETAERLALVLHLARAAARAGGREALQLLEVALDSAPVAICIPLAHAALSKPETAVAAMRAIHTATQRRNHAELQPFIQALRPGDASEGMGQERRCRLIRR